MIDVIQELQSQAKAIQARSRFWLSQYDQHKITYVELEVYLNTNRHLVKLIITKINDLLAWN